MNETDTYIAFYGETCISTGLLQDMLRNTSTFLRDKTFEGSDMQTLLIFNDRTGEQHDFDFRGSTEEVIAKALPLQQRRRVGRPKLGVTSREITLLPRHWEWLEAQPKSASASLRRLVEEAMKADGGEAAIINELAVTDRIMMALAGNLRDFEEASRALYAKNITRFKQCIATWPEDIKNYLNQRIDSILSTDK